MMTSRTENVGCCSNSGKRATRRVASSREHRQRTGCACAVRDHDSTPREHIGTHHPGKVQESDRRAMLGSILPRRHRPERSCAVWEPPGPSVSGTHA
ncbi:hypothetical protein DESPIG_00545 [Desulfovibrio piger ATCC 29098]|uniref:Uncharacterized protein n=1 Tax=Desulfovibrio piger ATCC 29098 TaxID=411464 RepID=B6WR65_9BACT|nr:hypothetical protein DESPIG_00545 [Desulfovibrio piger ATCC 29098]